MKVASNPSVTHVTCDVHDLLLSLCCDVTIHIREQIIEVICSTTEPIFALRILQEKYHERKKDLHMVFVDLEKAYDRVPCDLIWWALRKKNIQEPYITIIQDMYKATNTRVKTRCGLTQYYDIEVGLHQGSTLSPLLFIIIMDVLATIQRDPPWAMLFADDLVICEETRLEVEQQLDSWREVLEGNGLRISRKKT